MLCAHYSVYNGAKQPVNQGICTCAPLSNSWMALCYNIAYQRPDKAVHMAARDVFHQAVKAALVKDQWLITDDPFVLQVGGVDMYVDLGAEKLLAAEKDNRQIAVEIKSFLGPSLVSDFHLALGQFLNYRTALSQQEPHRRLYLAVPLEPYNTFFALPFIRTVVSQHQLALIVYDAVTQEVMEWID